MENAPVRMDANGGSISTVDEALACLVDNKTVFVRGGRYARCSIWPGGHITSGNDGDFGMSTICYRGSHVECIAHALGINGKELAEAKARYQARISEFCREFYGEGRQAAGDGSAQDGPGPA